MWINNRYYYVLPSLTGPEQVTLKWLAERGYDGGIYDAMKNAECLDGVNIVITECAAWDIKCKIEEDPEAWLACCGQPLYDKLQSFVDSIV